MDSVSGAQARVPWYYPFEFWEVAALAVLLFEFVLLAIYAGSQQSLLAFGILALVTLASASSGGLLGFLFGIPRYRSSPEKLSYFEYNTNLEQISDWLTKIIIGATLVQVSEIAEGVTSLSRAVGGQIGLQSADAAAGAAIVASFFCGFMWGYLWISIRVRGRLDPEDKKAA